MRTPLARVDARFKYVGMTAAAAGMRLAVILVVVAAAAAAVVVVVDADLLPMSQRQQVDVC
jgi:hypothetical protein